MISTQEKAEALTKYIISPKWLDMVGKKEEKSIDAWKSCIVHSDTKKGNASENIDQILYAKV